MSDNDKDRELGMARAITRRDFLNAIGIAVGTSLAANSTWLHAFGIPQSPFAPEKDTGYYPPAKTGMRGSHDGSWEVAHELRDGNDKDWADPVDDGESYDLSWSAVASAAWLRPTFTASLPDSIQRFSFSTTTTILADTPSEMSFKRASDFCSDTVERSPSR